MKTTFFLPIAIDVYTPEPPRDPDQNRDWFPPLPKVVTDVQALSDLFSSDRFRQAGFAVESRLTGPSFEILRDLKTVVGKLRKAGSGGLIVLWSGHGECLADGRLQLACREDQTPMIPGDGLSPAQIAQFFLAVEAPSLYLVMDVCHAGAASMDIAKTISDFWAASVPADRGLSVLCATGPESSAYDGALIPILIHLLQQGPSPKARAIIEDEQAGHWNDQDAWLSAALVNSTIEIELKAQQLPKPFTNLINNVKLFPNPLFRPASSPKLAEQARRAFLAADVESHFLPKARGLNPGEAGWFFTGRAAVTERIIERLHTPGTMEVLTGSGGSGKSAILGRLTLLSDRDAARKSGWLEADDSPATVPPEGWATASLHLRGLTAAAVLHRLAEILLGPETKAGDSDIDPLIKQVSTRANLPLVILDALDESLEPAKISNDVIVPLVRAGWRILLGTRRSAAARGDADLLAPFVKLEQAPAEDLDLNADTTTDIAAYVGERLRKSGGSPYLNLASDDPEVQQVSAAVADAAAGNFLYARITADSLVRRKTRLELKPGWQQRYLGSGLDGAFAKDLAEFDRRFQERFARTDLGASALMRALAWGRGAGLPLWDDLWPRLAAVISRADEPYTREHAEWLLFEAGRYIVEAGESEQAVYRLFHQSLTDYFRRDIDAMSVERRIFAELSDVARANRSPNAYIRRYLAAHAAGGRALDQLIKDPWLLVLCEPFIRYCDESVDTTAAGVMRVYRSVAHRLGTIPEQNAAHLLLAARLYAETDFENGMRGLGLALPFTAGWSNYLPAMPPSLVFDDYYIASAHRVAWHPTANLVAVADLRGVRYFHVEDGTPAGARIDLDLKNLAGLDWHLAAGEPVLAVASNAERQGSPRLWLIGSDDVARELALPTTAAIQALAWGHVKDRDMLAVAAQDGFWISDAASPGKFSKVDAKEFASPHAVCLGASAGKPAFLVLSQEGVFAWDGATSSMIAKIAQKDGMFQDRAIAFLGDATAPWIAVILGSRAYCSQQEKQPGTLVEVPSIDGCHAVTLFRDASQDPCLALSKWADGSIIVRNMHTGETGFLEGHEYAADDFAVREKGGRVTMISAGDRVRKWSVSNVMPRPRPASKRKQFLACGHDGTREILALSPGEQLLLESRDAHTGEKLAESQDASIGELAFAIDNARAILLVREPERLHVCDASTLAVLKSFSGKTLLDQARAAQSAGILLKPDQKLGERAFGEYGGEPVLVSPGNTGMEIRSIVSGALLYQVSGLPVNSLREVAWGMWQGAPIIASGGIDGPIALWRLPTAAGGNMLEAMPALQGHRAAIWCLAFGRVEGRLMLASGGMESPRIWDLETGQSLIIDIDHRITSLALSDSGFLAVGTDRGVITMQLSSSWLRGVAM